MRPRRLAVYGPISPRGGSTATAFFFVVEAWLGAGHEVDFYSTGKWIDLEHLLELPNLRTFPVPLPRWEWLRNPAIGQSRFGQPARLVMAQVLFEMHERAVARAILAAHRDRPYDALVVLNSLCRLPVGGALPIVSFPQGPPAGEGDFVRREPGLVRDDMGWLGLAVLRAGYAYRDPAAAKSAMRSDLIVVSSQWARSMFRRAGVPDERTAILYPPVDLARFTISPRRGDPNDFRFLWLGRIVPRKRFPLALDAFQAVRRRRPGVRLDVIGAPGYQGLIDRYRLPPLGPGVERKQPVLHSDVPKLLESIDVVLQPSENENFGFTPAEALATGIPTVLGPTNGTADALEDSVFRFDRYEVSAVASAMERAMDAVVADAAGIARRARAIAQRTLSVEATASRALELVDALVARRSH